MRAKYTIQAKANFPSNPQADGTTEAPRLYVSHQGEVYTEMGRALPELGPKRVFDRNRTSPLVLPIKGRNFKVTFEAMEDNYSYGGCPAPGALTFEETDEPETPHTLWDAKEVLERVVADLREGIAHAEKEGFSDEVKMDRDRLAEAETELAAGVWDRYSPNGVTSAFGQPVFIQNQCFPVHQGRCAFHLVTFETGWGDSGNENYMVALDDEGYPVAVFHEASCC